MKKIKWGIYREVLYKSWKEIIELIGLTFSVIIVFQTGLNLLSVFFGFIILISLGVAVYSICYSIYEVNANAYRSISGINKYMYSWLENNNRAIIFSRDMSWANYDEKIIEVLNKKALAGELTLILAERTTLVTELETNGAEFIEYGYLKHTPKTRFTFVNYGSMDEKVAIGKKDEDGVHRINEYSPLDAPVYFLANDLISILIKMDKFRGEHE